jgi:hypothetical protein
VNCWDVTMSFARSKLLQGFDVCIETCSVVHGQQIIRGPHVHVDEHGRGRHINIVKQLFTEVTR